MKKLSWMSLTLFFCALMALPVVFNLVRYKAAGAPAEGTSFSTEFIYSRLRSTQEAVEPQSASQTFPVDTADIWTRMVLVPEAAPVETMPTSIAGDDLKLHPNVIKAPYGWPDDPRTANTKPYWASMSPFGSVAPLDKENPEILHSDDGITWSVPAGLTNPIQARPAAPDNNADPGLFISDSVMYCYWIDNVGPAINLRYKTSRDGVAWSGTRTITYEGANMTAPIIRNVRDVWYLWYMDHQGNGSIGANMTDDVLMRETSTSPTGPYTTATVCTLNGTSNSLVTHYWWHGDIRYVKGTFVALASFSEQSWGFGWLFGTSGDGLTWEFDLRPGPAPYDTRLWRAPDGHPIVDTGSHYTPSMLWNEDGQYFDVWLSIVNTPNFDIYKAKLFKEPNPEYSFDMYGEYFTLLYEDGLLEGFWPMIQGGGTTIYDYSRKSNDLTASENFGAWDTRPILQNPVHTVSLNGTDEEADRVDDDDFSFGDGTDDDAFSVVFWCKVGNLLAEVDVVSKHDTPSDQEWRVSIDTLNRPRVWFFDQSVGATAYEGERTDVGLTEDVWHMCAVTTAATEGENKSDDIAWYVDGSLVLSTESSGPGVYVAMENKDAVLAYGYRLTNGTAGAFFVGELGPVAVVRQQLSAADIYRLWLLGRKMLNLAGAKNRGEW